MRKAEMVVLSDSVAINTCCGFQWGSVFLVSLVAFFSDRQGPGHHFKEGANENRKYFLACSTVLPKRRTLASTEWTLWEAGLVLLQQLRWDFRSGSSVGQVTGEGHRERAQGHHVHHLAHLQTMWNFLWDWKTPDVAHLESVASRFPGPILVFNMQWVLRTVWTFLELADLGELEVKKKKKPIYSSSKSSFKPAKHFNICSWKGNARSCGTGRQRGVAEEELILGPVLDPNWTALKEAQTVSAVPLPSEVRGDSPGSALDVYAGIDINSKVLGPVAIKRNILLWCIHGFGAGCALCLTFNYCALQTRGSVCPSA